MVSPLFNSSQLLFHFRLEQNRKTSTHLRFDAYCTYSRLATTGIASELNDSAVHEVKVRVLADKFDKENILFEKNRPDFAKSPAKYEPTNWYAGAIFLIGELAD